ncbi:MAG: response regulator [Minisyncoccia bacterium]
MEKTKILVVDDDKEIRDYFKEAFVLKGFDVVTASNGILGLESALKEKPQFILSDINMPELDGMGMLKQLRSSGDWGKKVPVIMLTNIDPNENIMKDVVESEPSFYFLKSETSPTTIIEKLKEITDLQKIEE